MGCIKEADVSDYQATAKASPRLAQANQDETGDPVNVVTGAFTLTEQDIAFSSQRLSLNLTRHYNNQLHDADPKKSAGPFGRGWTHSLNVRLEPGPEPGQKIYVDDRGTQISFRPNENSTGYLAPPGSLGLELLRLPHGGFSLRQIDGLTAEFNQQGRILTLARPGPEADSHLDFHYDRQDRLAQVSGTGGRALTFSYSGDANLIRSVTDHTGRSWHYRYNQQQELIEVQDPLGRIRRYGYEEWHGPVSTARGETEPRTIRAMSKVFRYLRDSEKGEPVAELTNQYTTDRRVYRQVDALGNVTRFDYNCFARITYVTDPAGWTTVYGYDEAGNTTKVRRPGGGTTEYIFDHQRNLIADLDQFGYATEYVELRDHNLLSREQEFGRRAIGNRSSYTTLNDNDILLGYDQWGNRPLVRDALGNTTRFYDYTRFGQPQRIALPDGTEIHFEYDQRSGLPTRMTQTLTAGRTQPLLRIQEWKYDRLGNLVRHMEWADSNDNAASRRRIVAVAYDPDGHHPISRREWIEVNGQGEDFAYEEQYEWDTLGCLVARTTLRRDMPGAAAKTFTTHFGYDAVGRQIWQIDCEGTATCWNYDLQNRVVETFSVAKAEAATLTGISKERRLNRQRWHYDLMGREIRFIDPMGATTTREWDERGLCIAVTDPLGLTTRYEYDRDSNQTAQRTVTDYEIRTCYDLAGRSTAQIDSLGRAIKYTYDPIGRVNTVTEGSNEKAGTTAYTYDALGRLNRISYADKAYEHLIFDEQGNLIQRERGQEHEPALSVEAFTYDIFGRQTGILVGTSKQLKSQFALQYNDLLREVQVYDALGNLSRTFYDSLGNVIRKVDAEGRVLHLEYDGRNRLYHRWAEDGSVASRYEYDVLDQLTKATEQPVEYRWQYNAAGQIMRHDQTIDQRTESIVYAYDAGGRLTQKQLDQEWWMRFTYTSNSPFVSQINIPGSTITIQTDSVGHVVDELWNDGGRTHYMYDPSGSLTDLESFDRQNKLVFAQHLVHDNRGRPAEEKRLFSNRGTHYQYSYDALDRLERVYRQDAMTISEFRRYVYDERGNRLEEHQDGVLYATYQYDQANCLIEIRDTIGETQLYKYDRCGNLIHKDGQKFTYDATQRLRQITQDEKLVVDIEYYYAATDERTLIKCLTPQKTERIIYDGIQEIISDSPPERRKTIWGFYADSLIATSVGMENPKRSYTTSIGSVITIDSDKDVRDYDPFGEFINIGGIGQILPYGFCGKRYDTETNFYYGRARLYDPRSGRFIQPDPLGPIDGPNLYLYARNNPLVYGDLLGLTSVKNAQGSISETNKPVLLLPAPKPGIYLKPLDELGRPSGAQALITMEMIGTGTSVPSSLRPAGFRGARANHQRGHLIARELGGSGKDPRNIVTMNTSANNPAMRLWERNVRGLAEQGRTVYYEVTPIYNGQSLVARGFTIQISIAGKTIASGSVLN
ncbi:MAG: DNA/RNA non-specific endonuclease [Caldilineaceae bacterium]